MAGIDISRLRNVVLLSHSGAGTTSLSEALLFNTKAINRLGEVEDGNTVSDYEPEEIKRRTSVQTALIPCLWNGHKANFLDTPGYNDFHGEVISALRVVESAVVVVSAIAGVEVGTEQARNLCEERGIPYLIFINKMDRENADFHRSLQSIQAVLGRKCVPLQIPIGAEQQFKGIINLLESSAEVPPELRGEVETARERLIEAVAESDDDMATKYLEGEELSHEEIGRGLKNAVLSGRVIPVLAGSATLNLGVEEVLSAVIDYLPSPPEGRRVAATNPSSGEQQEVTQAAEAPLACLVFKTTADPFVGKLSLFRIYGGSFSSNSEVWNAGQGQAERIGQVYFLRGKNQEATSDIGPGDIGAVAKLAVTITGDTLCQRDHPLLFERIVFPMGHYTMAVSPKTKADLDKMSTAMARIVEEDPSLRLTREPSTNETLVAGLGDTHLETTIERVRRKFGAELTLQLPKIPYRETITTVTSSEYKHKKQSGGHGQYGHVFLRLEPRERDYGFEFGKEIVGGAIPKEYIPAVEKGVVKALQEGVLAGYPIVDLKAVLYDGSYHDVDSSGISFEIAGSHALRKGVAEAHPVLLEPIMKLTVRVPDNFTGDVIGDLNSKRGRIIGMILENGVTVIEADVPQAELLRYAPELRSLTQGRASYTLEFSHYEGVPSLIEQKKVDEAKRTKEEARA